MSFLSLDNVNMYVAIVLSIINGLLMCFASYKFFQIIQLSGYKLKGYFVWLKDTKASYCIRVILLSLLSLFCVLVTNALFNVYHEKALYSYIGLIFYFYFTIVFIVNLYSAPKKIPLKNTTRMTRLNVAMFIFTSLLSFFLIAISTEYLKFLQYGALCLVPLFLPFIVPLVHIILIPNEKLVMLSYVNRAKKKLKKCENLIKIGITGSFGKTSTKYILNTLLLQKYKVCMSPHSFNTLSGLCKVINNYLNFDDEVLIAEMGARNVGDIKELATLIKPKYALITGVGSQHLHTFKTKENILKTKFELVESLEDKDSIAFFSTNSGSQELYSRTKNVKKVLVGENVKAKNIVTNEYGTTFDLYIKNKKYSTQTRLLGYHNVENILMCVEVALALGLKNEEILRGINALQPVPHRLELVKTNDYLILDDAYNASAEGVKSALDVLKLMPNRKIVITPGLVELGQEEFETNKNFGKLLSHIADYVIIVNKVNFEAIKQGLDEENFSEEKIYQAETLDKAKLLLKDFARAGDTILLENDLPDNYI